MNDRVFLDTNVFIYLYDSDQPDKQARARALVERFGLSDAIVISTGKDADGPRGEALPPCGGTPVLRCKSGANCGHGYRRSASAPILR